MTFVMTTWWGSARSQPERRVSPLLGLLRADRRQATAPIDRGHPAEDPELRQLELLRARQLVCTAPHSPGAALTGAGIQAIAAVVTFFASSPALAVFWLLVAGWTGVSTLRLDRRGKAAAPFVDRVDEPPPSHQEPH